MVSFLILSMTCFSKPVFDARTGFTKWINNTKRTKKEDALFDILKYLHLSGFQSLTGVMGLEFVVLFPALAWWSTDQHLVGYLVVGNLFGFAVEQQFSV